MSEDKILTIGIPVYNGSEYLRDTIVSIIEQFQYINLSEIEILISDNASTDSTPSIVESFLKTNQNTFSYYRNEKNVGYDRNVDQIFKKAKGEYIEILGDDDYYKNSFCLAKIIELLKKNIQASVFLLTIDLLDIPTNKLIEGFRVKEDLICNDPDYFFSLTKWGTAAVSSLIIKKNNWNEIAMGKYFGTQWIHVAAIINILKKHPYAYIIADSMIVVRYRNARWEKNNGNQLELGLKHLDIFQELLMLGYKKETLDIFVEERYNDNLQSILTLKPHKIRDRVRVTRLMIKYFKYKTSFWLIHIPAMFLPKWIFEYIANILISIIEIPKKIIYKSKTKLKKIILK